VIGAQLVPIEELEYYLNKVISKLQEKYNEGLRKLEEAKASILSEAERKFNEIAGEPRRVAKKQR
jgi:dsDNA-specific endonuclease/ATPase MutS2